MAFASNHNDKFGIRWTLLPWTTRIPDKLCSVTCRHWTIATVGLWPRRKESKAGEFCDYSQLPSRSQFPATVQDQQTQAERAVLLNWGIQGDLYAQSVGGRVMQEVAAQKKLWSSAECPLHLSQKHSCTYMYEETA